MGEIVTMVTSSSIARETHLVNTKDDLDMYKAQYEAETKSEREIANRFPQLNVEVESFDAWLDRKRAEKEWQHVIETRRQAALERAANYEGEQSYDEFIAIIAANPSEADKAFAEYDAFLSAEYPELIHENAYESLSFKVWFSNKRGMGEKPFHVARAANEAFISTKSPETQSLYRQVRKIESAVDFENRHDWNGNLPELESRLAEARNNLDRMLNGDNKAESYGLRRIGDRGSSTRTN